MLGKPSWFWHPVYLKHTFYARKFLREKRTLVESKKKVRLSANLSQSSCAFFGGERKRLFISVSIAFMLYCSGSVSDICFSNPSSKSIVSATLATSSIRKTDVIWCLTSCCEHCLRRCCSGMDVFQCVSPGLSRDVTEDFFLAKQMFSDVPLTAFSKLSEYFWCKRMFSVVCCESRTLVLVGLLKNFSGHSCALALLDWCTRLSGQRVSVGSALGLYQLAAAPIGLSTSVVGLICVLSSKIDRLP